MERIGFVGLGAMGTPMAWNILKGGYELTVWNRTRARSRPFRERGVHVADSPADLARHVDAVVIMVTGSSDLLDVLQGDGGALAGLGAGMTVINMSTVARAVTEEAASLVRETGARFVDAPVSGTVEPAKQGQLVILAGGKDEDIDAAEPLLLTMGNQVVRCGGIGQGTSMKLVINLMLAGMTALLAEGLVTGESFGLDPERILEALENGGLAAPLFQAKGRAILAGRYEKQFPVDYLLKDLDLLLEAAGGHGRQLRTTAAVRELFQAARNAGLGNEDLAAVYKVVKPTRQP